MLQLNKGLFSSTKRLKRILYDNDMKKATESDKCEIFT